jgi:hypothetical protein
LTLTEPTQAHLYVHAFNFRKAWREAGGGPEMIVAQLAPAGLADDHYELETPRGKRSEAATCKAAAKAIRNGEEGAYVVRARTAGAATLELYDYGTMLSATISVPLSDGTLSLLLSLVDLAKKLDTGMAEFGDIGPTMWLILPGRSYPRPLPPRRSPRVGEAVWAYFFSRSYFRDQPNESWKSNLKKLENAPLAPNLVRESDGDLLVIRVERGREDRAALLDGLGQLEKWIGETLDLPRDQDFKENGDQRWPVWQPERIKPFSFYDVAKKIAYKVVAEDAQQHLDPETMAELATALPLRKMPDGRAIVSTMVVFVERGGAVANLSAMQRLGAAGTLYRDSEDFWNPKPPGDWIISSNG